MHAVAQADVVIAGQRQAVEVSRGCYFANAMSQKHLDVCTVARLTMYCRLADVCYCEQCHLHHFRGVNLLSPCIVCVVL